MVSRARVSSATDSSDQTIMLKVYTTTGVLEGMHDPFPEMWRKAMSKLPNALPLVLHPQRNIDAENLSCIICDLGAEDRPPEWIVTVRSYNSTITKGLHEYCRSRHHNSRYGKAIAMHWFGKSWESPLCDDSRRVIVPPNTKCQECQAQLTGNDQGVVLGDDHYHKDCFLKAAAEAGIV